MIQVDFILTDPPYITSKETGMDNFKKMIDENKEAGIEFVKSEEEWESVKDNFKDKFSEFSEETMKTNYIIWNNLWVKI